jgi:hypothetical protein
MNLEFTSKIHNCVCKACLTAKDSWLLPSEIKDHSVSNLDYFELQRNLFFELHFVNVLKYFYA